MEAPLVTVICLCYNHEKFVREAIQSVLDQSYKNIEIIVVDDASTDGSSRDIEKIAAANPRIRYFQLKQNLGNCAAFNTGWRNSSGEFVVDFSTDDVMLPHRIEKQVELFQKLDKKFGVVFTDVVYVDEDGFPLYTHFDHLIKHGLIREIAEGDVYAILLSTYYISSPSMLVRRQVLERLGGYDEQLAYEDFDFWVRSSRDFYYAFLDAVLTKVRKTRGSLSTRAYSRGDKQLQSTYRVCEKALTLNRSSAEHAALAKRVRYEWRHAVLSENFAEANLFYGLLRRITSTAPSDWPIMIAQKFRFPFAAVRRLYHRLRFGNLFTVILICDHAEVAFKAAHGNLAFSHSFLDCTLGLIHMYAS
jgi:glycosyltransferase involved in cell wall biosynthesis